MQENFHNVGITIKNGGQTPSSDTAMNLGFEEFPKGTRVPANLPLPDISGRSLPIAGVIPPASVYLLSNETTTLYGPADALTFMRVKARLSDVIIFGSITYRDTFYQVHVTDFCRIYQVYSNDTDGYAYCSNHNGDRETRHPWWYWIFPVE
jgi:hypothetical protein